MNRMKFTHPQAIERIGFEAMNSPLCLLLVGLPGSGKSTFVKELTGALNVEFVVASTDDLVEQEAVKLGLTYTEAFEKVSFKKLQAKFKENIQYAALEGKHVIIDRTNMTPKLRRTNLDLLKITPEKYLKVALKFDAPEKVIIHRLLERAKTGKNIGIGIMRHMAKSYLPPTKAEGFDEIWDVTYQP